MRLFLWMVYLFCVDLSVSLDYVVNSEWGSYTMEGDCHIPFPEAYSMFTVNVTFSKPVRPGSWFHGDLLSSDSYGFWYCLKNKYSVSAGTYQFRFHVNYDIEGPANGQCLWIAGLNDKCLSSEPEVGGLCTFSTGCGDVHAECLENLCVCVSPYYLNMAEKVCIADAELGDTCSISEICSATNSECIENFCVCSTGFEKDGQLCVVTTSTTITTMTTTTVPPTTTSTTKSPPTTTSTTKSPPTTATSQTSTSTTSSSSTSTPPALPVSISATKAPTTCSCQCSTFKTYNASTPRTTDEIVKDLTVNRSTLSATKRKKNSAVDDRSSSKSIGVVGIAVLVSVIAILVGFDLSLLYKQFN